MYGNRILQELHPHLITFSVSDRDIAILIDNADLAAPPPVLGQARLGLLKYVGKPAPGTGFRLPRRRPVSIRPCATFVAAAPCRPAAAPARCKSSTGTGSRTCRFLLRHFSKAAFSSALIRHPSLAPPD